MRDFGADQANRIGIYRSIHWGVKRPAKPRRLPDFREACVLIDGTRSGRSLGFRLDGGTSAMSNGLIEKLYKYDLVDSYRFDVDGCGYVTAFLLNAHGMELFIRGNVDTSLPASASALRFYEMVLASRDRSQILSNGVDLKRRNSLLGVDTVEFATDAKTVGVYKNAVGFMAVAYDSHGVRVTDIFIQNFEPGDRESKLQLALGNDEYPIKQDDLHPARVMAKLLNVREDKIFYDERLEDDIWNSEHFDYAGRIWLTPALRSNVSPNRQRGFSPR